MKINMITKAVIPAAGVGERLLPATKEQPKELLPVFARGVNGDLCLKPLIQSIFEQLFTVGIREFCFIVGRSKRAIEDHFTPDYSYLERLYSSKKEAKAKELNSFYALIEKSKISWINQNLPSGFGHAVLQAETFVGDNDFLIHAGDTLIMSEGDWHLKRCMQRKIKADDDATLVVRRVQDPRRFGVVRAKKIGKNEYSVLEAIEKPIEFISDLALMPVYSFERSIFSALKKVKPGVGGEIQLTDGIQHLIKGGKKVRAIEITKSIVWIDVGTPESYWTAQELTHRLYSKDS
jgi:UTP--glucose-1-phosphate uridylyltransferase